MYKPTNIHHMKIIHTKELTSEQFNQIDQLWNDEYPINLNGRFKLLLDGVEDFNHYLMEENGKVIAWAVDFKKDDEIRFSIIVHRDYQGKGYGKILINELKESLDEFYGWVIHHNNDLKTDGTHYQSPIGFYLKDGFKIVKNELIDTEMIRAIKIKYHSGLGL